MKTVLNPHLVNKAVDIYATTPNVQHNFVADELGISYKTLLKLRKDADFWKKVWDTYLVTYEADVLDVCRSMVGKHWQEIPLLGGLCWNIVANSIRISTSPPHLHLRSI